VLKAAEAALHGAPRKVALGSVEYQGLGGNRASRFFVVAAGAGVDAHLFYKLHAGTKHRMGMAAYYAKAWHLWFTHPMTKFQVEFAESGSGATQQVAVTELLAVRIRNFGGVLQQLAPGASLERDDVRLISCETSSRSAYLLYVTRGLLRQNWKVPGIDLAYSKKISCRPMASGEAGQGKIYVEADGELVGMLPAEVTVVPEALTLLFPR
jgi:diacylglycerol kinase (ATP)